MREILFRGKVADEPDEWVYGYLLPDARIIQTVEFTENKCCGVGTFQIRPETVGQYTGMTDKNGKKMFEGDIVRITTTVKTDWIKDENGNYKEPKRTDCAIVQHDKNTGGYKLKVYNKGIYKRIAKFDLVHIGYYYGAEVIGNIHDNPELLK